MSAETHTFAEQWQALQEIFAAIFEWIGEQVKYICLGGNTNLTRTDFSSVYFSRKSM